MRTGRRRLSGLPLLALLTSACAHTVTVVTPAPSPATPGLHARLPVVVEYVGVRSEGIATNLRDVFINRVVARVRDTGFFPEVYEPERAYEAPADSLRLSVEIEQTEETGNRFVVTTKVAIVLCSFLLLTPVLPLRYDFAADLTATLAEPDGGEHVYRGKASGWVRYFVLSDPLRAGDDTRRAVVDRALDLLLHDLTRDEELATLASP